MGAHLVYDISEHATFENLDRWVSEFRSIAQPDLAIILIGNKCDMAYAREVAQDEAIRHAERLKIPFFETSALDCTNVEVVFMELLTTIARRTYASFVTKLADKVDISKINTIKLVTGKKKKKGCYKGWLNH
ncbi:unnamed protein product [Blepharisma stoltei]|uniref:Uncharacterized protein n=1 Tax=Blepharisma stoltei TaxID=1481888 RepID=A0AAU9KAR0_9CILI|nr:unnamed protein product [Blepharisma stoltei]